MCGYLKVLSTKIQSIEISHNDVAEEIKLPRKMTKLADTISVLHILQRASSAKITQRLVDLGLDLTVNDVSSYLTILRSKGLVEVVESRRGVPGGSTWKLSDDCLRLLGLSTEATVPPPQ